MTERNNQPTLSSGTKNGLLISFGIGLGVMFGRILKREDQIWESEHWILLVRAYAGLLLWPFFLGPSLRPLVAKELVAKKRSMRRRQT
jgi:hypothetical protein